MICSRRRHAIAAALALTMSSAACATTAIEGHAGPASSAGTPTRGALFAVPEPSFDESAFDGSERVVLRALKTYGMLLSDGGEIALTFADDRLSGQKWATLGVDAQSFADIAPADFDVVDLDPEIDATYDCVRNP